MGRTHPLLKTIRIAFADILPERAVSKDPLVTGAAKKYFE
jgi:hypothetical protein